MRDLVETNHLFYSWEHPHYYDVRSFRPLNNDDYYFTEIEPYRKNIEYNVFCKTPWTYISFIQAAKLISGWKIHISATLDNHSDILRIVAKYAFEKHISFKYASSKKDFISLNSKMISRSSSGKFIVLYPEQSDFQIVLDELYILLKDFEGPYILSDKNYKDSKVLFYRYGEINPITFLDDYGTITSRIINTKTNELVIDKRQAYFVLPDWVVDIDLSKPKTTESELLSKYHITKSLYFSAQGGVYLGTNLKDNQVYVIKEARSFAGIDIHGVYGTSRLKHEYEILKKLDDTNATPRVKEIINELGNTYLVEEYVSGETLKSFPHRNSPYINQQKDIDNLDSKPMQEYITLLEKIMVGTLKSISEIHKKGIVINDISHGNIMFDSNTGIVKFIDFEIASSIEENKTSDAVFQTPGFSCPSNSCTVIQAELYKVGLIFLYCIVPYNALYHLSSQKVFDCLERFYSTTVLPKHLLNIIENLLCYKYNIAEEALKDLLDNNKDSSRKAVNTSIINYNKLLNSVCKNISDFIAGKDILGTDTQGISTNKFCLSFGVFGMLDVVKDFSSALQQNNILNYSDIIHYFMKSFYKEKYSISLFVGLSGIASTMLDLGYNKEADLIMRKATAINTQTYDYAYGLAGRGITLLKFYDKTKSQDYLEYAISDALTIQKNEIEIDGLIYWRDSEGDIYAGLTRGNAGIALYFLHLYLTTNKSNYLDYGVKVLNTDIKRIYTGDDGFMSLDRQPLGSKVPVYSPYIHTGLAGLGCVLVRFYLVTKNIEYLELINKIIENCYSKFVLFPGYLRGAIGLMSFYQDCAYILSISEAEPYIDKYFSQLPLYYVELGEFAGFAGDELFRISHDLHTGTCGVLAMYNRYKNKNRANPFMIGDEIFEKF